MHLYQDSKYENGAGKPAYLSAHPRAYAVWPRLFLTVALALAGSAGGRAWAGENDEAPAIRLAAVGDIMLGQKALDLAAAGVDVFQELKPLLADRQVVFGNLEGPLTDRGAPTKDVSSGRYYVFRSPPDCGRLLKEAGFNLLSLANNHVNDYGPAGREQTAAVLDELGLVHAGAPGEVGSLMVGEIRIAFIALAPNSGCQDLNDLPGAAALVEKEARQPDTLVIVSFHGGGEGSAFMRRVSPLPEYYLGENRGNLPELAHALIDAGADVILGHGPHVPRGLEFYRGRLIAWSLGNFATLSGMNIDGPGGQAPLILADLNLDGSLRRLKVVSFRQSPDEGPRLDPEGGAGRIMAELSRGDMDLTRRDVPLESGRLTSQGAQRIMGR